jgi:hypothetical protein
MRAFAECAIVLAGLLGLLTIGVLGATQRTPESVARSLWLNLTREAWVLTRDLPGHFRFCAEQDGDMLRGCVTARELREKAEKERAARKAQPAP